MIIETGVNLHSTMFLLIRVLFKCTPDYGGINLHSTMFLLIPLVLLIKSPVIIFTFHNVSINTERFDVFACPRVVIYIPQCFY